MVNGERRVVVRGVEDKATEKETSAYMAFGDSQCMRSRESQTEALYTPERSREVRARLLEALTATATKWRQV